MENKYEIVRSVSKTVQVRQFEPISHFCSVKEGFDHQPTLKEMEKASKKLADFAEKEVMNSIKKSLDSYLKEKENVETPKAEKTPYLKPWQKQMRDSMARAQEEFGEEARRTIEKEKGRPVYTMTENGKELVVLEGNSMPY